MNIKVGDRIRVVRECDIYKLGDIYTITEIDFSNYVFKIKERPRWTPLEFIVGYPDLCTEYKLIERLFELVEQKVVKRNKLDKIKDLFKNINHNWLRRGK